MSFSRIDLVFLGGEATPDWPHGEVRRAEATPTGLATALAASSGADPGNAAGSDDGSAVLLWDARHALPSASVLAALSEQSVDLWHTGLRLGTAGLPRLLDRTRPTWMHNRDPDPSRTATSWRLHPGATLIRSRALRHLGGPGPAYSTLLGCGLDLGHRYLRSGAVTRFEPSLLAASAGPPPGEDALPLEDELRFIRRRFGDGWARWASLRAILSGLWTAPAVRRAWRATADAVREPTLHLPPRAPSAEAESPGNRVTVLIPTLDRYEHLDHLLAQLPRQSLPPAEVIVVDQTPAERRRVPAPEPTEQQSAERWPPIRWQFRDQAGQCSSRNYGLSIATGDYVLFLDDDDDLLPADLIEAHLGNLSTYGADASCGTVDETGAGPPPPDFELFRVSDVLPTNNCMIRRGALERSGLFDLAYERGARADADLGMRLYLSGALAVLDPRISLRHLRAASGGLRAWGARRQTYAGARRSLWRHHLPSATEIYLARRYFSPTQVRERLWIAAASTLSGSGPAWRRAFTAGLGLVAMPLTLLRLWRRFHDAGRLLERFPRIGTLTARSPDLGLPRIDLSSLERRERDL